MAKGRPTAPLNALSASFVDGSRIYNESTKIVASKWKVSLLRLSEISKIVVWNSDYSLPSLNITLFYGTMKILKTKIDQKGLCRYEWILPFPMLVTSVRLQTSASSDLHVDEVEVLGQSYRGMNHCRNISFVMLWLNMHLFVFITGQQVNLSHVGATVKQYPGRVKLDNTTMTAENAINSILEQNSGRGHGFLKCSSTLRKNIAKRPWFLVDLKNNYFITDIKLFLRKGKKHRAKQIDLTVHVTNTRLRSRSRALSSSVNASNRCGKPYSSVQDKIPVFPCDFPRTSQYVVLTLPQPQSRALLQVCEIQVFGKI